MVKKREMSRTAFHSKDSQKQVWHRRGAFLGLFVEKSQLSSFFLLLLGLVGFSRVSRVRVEIRVSARIRVSLVLQIGWG